MCGPKTFQKIVITITLTLSNIGFFMISGAEAQQVADDKALHFGVAASAQTGCAVFGRSVVKNKWTSNIACFMAINALGVFKEITDPSRGGEADEADIYANLAGSGLSFLSVSIAF